MGSLSTMTRVHSAFTFAVGIALGCDSAPGQVNGQVPVNFSVSPDLSSVTPEPAGTPVYKTRYTGFAPRIGLAYTLASSSRYTTVFRAGFGFFYDTNDAIGSSFYGSYPFGSNLDFEEVPFPFTAAQTASPPLSVPVAYPYGSIFAANPNLRRPLTYSWSGALEQSIGNRSSVTATYIGNRGSLLLQSIQNVLCIRKSRASPTP